MSKLFPRNFASINSKLMKLISISFLFVLFVGMIGTSVQAALKPSNLGNLQVDIPEASSNVFGVEETPIYIDGTLTSGMSRINGTTTNWVRGPEIVWSDVQPNNSTQFNWSALNQAANELNEIVTIGGFTPIVVVRGTPAWAQKYSGFTCGPIAAANFSDFAEFIYKALTDVNSPISSYNIQYIEIWNEPDIKRNASDPNQFWGGCWGEDTDQYFGGGYYSQMLSVVYPRIKQANANAKVLVGGLNLDCSPSNPSCNSLPSKFLEGILVDGNGTNFDGVAIHAFDGYQGALGNYSNTKWNSAWNTTGPSLHQKSNYVKELLASYAVTGKILMVTENTLICDSCTNDTVFENTKAYYLAQAYAGAMAEGLEANIWFDVLGTWLRNNGLVKINSSLDTLPAYNAYTVAANKLSSLTYMRRVIEFGGVTGHEFIGASNHIWMLWSLDGQNHTITLPATPISIQDVFGQSQTLSRTITLTLKPLYIEMPASVPRSNLPIVMRDFLTFQNGDFELGTKRWTLINQGLPASLISVSPTNPITGLPDADIPNGINSSQLGNFGYPCSPNGVPIGYAAVEQQFTVPEAPGKQVRLEFNYIIYTQDASISSLYDRFEVYIVTTGGSQLRFSDGNAINSTSCSKWWRVPGVENPRGGKTSGWASASIDLGAYRGQTVKVSFQNHSRFDGWFNTISYVDNVNVVIQP